MMMTTSAALAGKEIRQTLGIVRGNTIRARHVGRDFLAAFRMVVGGEISDYTKMMAEAREQSLDRMIAEAEQLGANAVLDVRFSTSYIANGAAEILVYGTAVIMKE